MSLLSGHRVYLDHNGSTPVTPEVVRAMRSYIEGVWGNAGAGHPDGTAARAAIATARAQVAAAIGGAPEEVTFTSGGTESNNAILTGLAEAELLKGGARRHIVVGRHEHLSVVRTVEALQRRDFRVTWVDPEPTGAVAPAALDAAITPETLVVALMFANNETGVLQPVQAAAEVAHRAGALLFVDAVCGAGKVPVDVTSLGCDLLSVSGHKLHAPKGVGAVWARRGVELAPIIHGCGQQGGLRSGTENTMGAIGLGAAMELHAAPGAVPGPGLRTLRDRLLEGVLALGVGAERNGGPPAAARGPWDLPNTFSVWFPGHDALDLQARLGELGLSVSAQASRPAGAAGGPSRPSHVLLAMGLPEARASESLRFSLGSTTVPEEIDAALRTLSVALHHTPS